VIVDEAVPHRQVGGPAVTGQQLTALAETASWPNVKDAPIPKLVICRKTQLMARVEVPASYCLAIATVPSKDVGPPLRRAETHTRRGRTGE
jgi:hypothetical protein